MAEYVTKQDVVQAVLSGIGIDSHLPRLAFDNAEQAITCENCGDTGATAFRYNGACAAGTDSVVFEWEPNLYRLIVRGHKCEECGWHRVIFEYPRIEGSVRENDPEKIKNVELGSSEVVSESDGEPQG